MADEIHTKSFQQRRSLEKLHSNDIEIAIHHSIRFATNLMRKKLRSFNEGEEIMIRVEAALWHFKHSSMLRILYEISYWIGRIQGYIEGRLYLRKLSREHMIRRPPGSRLNSFLKFLYSKKTYEKIFEPTISDMQLEYCEALFDKCFWKARWVRFRGYYSVCNAALLHAPVSSFKMIAKIWTTVS